MDPVTTITGPAAPFALSGVEGERSGFPSPASSSTSANGNDCVDS